MTDDIDNYILDILNAPTDRDKQTKVGPSNLSNACSYCLAVQMLNGQESKIYENSYWLGAKIGTCVHEYVDGHSAHPTAIREQKNAIGEIPGYGTIKGSTDVFFPVDGVVGDLKGLALDTLLPTPQGWTTMGEVAVGDYLISRNGEPTRVTHKSEVKSLPCFRLTFDDGNSVVCDEEHRWVVVRGYPGKESVVTARELFKSGVTRGGQRHVRVPTCDPFDVPDVDLPIDPYVLGAWLGDGDARSGRITKPDMRLWDELVRRGYTYSDDHSRNEKAVGTRTLYGLHTQLRELGLLGNKHVPLKYLRASRAQRLDLLRGYMDTDGSFNTKRIRAHMGTTSRQQAEDVAQLVLSLGWRTKIQDFTATWQGGAKPGYSVEFTPDENPFLVRNQHIEFSASNRSKRRVLVSIEQVDSVPTQCVAVDSRDHTYLCTDKWIPTHNTTTRDKLKTIKLAIRDEPNEYESTKVRDARAKVSAYQRQVWLYGLGWEQAGYTVNGCVVWFVCRDGQGAQDIWPWRFPYSRERAEGTLDRAKRLWEYLQDGNTPDSLNSHPSCWACNVNRRTKEVEG